MDKIYDSAIASTAGLVRAKSWVMSLAALFQILCICGAAYSIYWLVRKPSATASADSGKKKDDKETEAFWSSGRIITLLILCVYAIAQVLGLFGSTTILMHTMGGGHGATPSLFKTPSTDLSFKA